MSQQDYPSAAYILSLIGGIFIVLVGIFVAVVGAAFTFFIGGLGGLFGLIGVVFGAIIIYGATQLKSNPSQHATWGAIILVFSLISWVGALGGFFIGFLLAFIGGILAIVWSPSRAQAAYAPSAYAPAYGPASPPQAAPTAAGRYCPNCGRPLSADVKFCPNCGKEVG